MSAIRSCMSIAVLLMLALPFDMCVADNLIVRNARTNKTERVMLACHAPVPDFWSLHQIVWGVEMPTINVPYLTKFSKIQSGAPVTGLWEGAYYCNALWNGFRVKVYRSYEDHMACENTCTIELRDNGSFRLNEDTNSWDMIGKAVRV